MSSLFSIGLFLFVAAATPGPNNLVVLRTAARNGWRAALPGAAGIIAGGLMLLAVVIAGAGKLFVAWPPLRAAVEVGGAACLAWMGAWMCFSAGRHTEAPWFPAGVPGLFAFQFLNPKAWVMVLTVVAALPAMRATDTLLRLAPLFVCIPALCLLSWALLGGALSRHLARPRVRTWTDRVLGALLVLAALLLFF